MIGAQPRTVAHMGAVLGVAVLCWAALIVVARASAAMAMGSSMGLSALPFLGVWAVMMAAMMLPAVAPVASLYTRSIGTAEPARLAQFGLGYLLIWIVIGLPAYGVAVLIDGLAMSSTELLRWGVVAVLAAVAVYQLTPLKQVCLKHCRSPLAQLLHYANFGGSARDLRVGLHHGAYCAGCCWPLMLLLVAVGTMNVGAMLVLTAVVAAEKVAPVGLVVARAVALAAVVAAAMVAAFPSLLDLVRV